MMAFFSMAHRREEPHLGLVRFLSLGLGRPCEIVQLRVVDGDCAASGEVFRERLLKLGE
jgi:hypothetical protein